MLRSICLFVLASLLAALACAQSKTDPAGTKTNKEQRVEKGRQFLGLAPSADPAAAARGQKLFLQNCGFCHGQNATGAEGPDLVRSTVVLHDENGEHIGQVLATGRVDRGMPAFPSLTPDQVHDISAFLHSRVEAAANRWTYKILNVVTGDPQQGKVFFDAHCPACHNPAGNLAHVAAKFEPADLQTEFLYPASSKLPIAALVKAHDGQQQWSGVLKYIDDFTISITDSSGQLHRWPRSEVDIQLKDPLDGHGELLALYTNADMHNVLAYLETLK